jgi:hypothetical protein
MQSTPGVNGDARAARQQAGTDRWSQSVFGRMRSFNGFSNVLFNAAREHQACVLKCMRRERAGTSPVSGSMPHPSGRSPLPASDIRTTAISPMGLAGALRSVGKACVSVPMRLSPTASTLTASVRRETVTRGRKMALGNKENQGRKFPHLLPRSIAGFLPPLPGIPSPPTNPSLPCRHIMSTTVKIDSRTKDIFPRCPCNPSFPSHFTDA